MKIEQKSFKIEMKALNEDGTFEGLGASFDNVDFSDDIIVKGAFAQTLIDTPINEVRMLWQHDHKEVIGRFTEAVETDQGLLVKGELFIDDITRAKEAYKLIKKEALGGLSIGFRVVEQSFDKGIRFLKQLSLHEISLVTFPCNDLAKVTNVKSIKESIETQADFEKHLRDLGYSRKDALIICSKGYRALQSDSVEEDESKELMKLLVENKLN